MNSDQLFEHFPMMPFLRSVLSCQSLVDIFRAGPALLHYFLTLFYVRLFVFLTPILLSVQMMLPDIFGCSFAFLGFVPPKVSCLSFVFLNDDEDTVTAQVAVRDGLLGMLAAEQHPM
jgi:hypothetical protein